MWDRDLRPAVLVVLGHLSADRVADEPDLPRISIRAAERFLDTDLLRRAGPSAGRRGRDRTWLPPTRSIVLLLGCYALMRGLMSEPRCEASATP